MPYFRCIFSFQNSLTFRVLKFQGNFPWYGSLFYPLDCILSGIFNSRHSCPSTLGNYLNYFFDFSVSFWIICYSRCWTAWIWSFNFLILSHSHFLSAFSFYCSMMVKSLDFGIRLSVFKSQFLLPNSYVTVGKINSRSKFSHL